MCDRSGKTRGFKNTESCTQLGYRWHTVSGPELSPLQQKWRNSSRDCEHIGAKIPGPPGSQSCNGQHREKSYIEFVLLLVCLRYCDVGLKGMFKERIKLRMESFTKNRQSAGYNLFCFVLFLWDCRTTDPKLATDPQIISNWFLEYDIEFTVKKDGKMRAALFPAASASNGALWIKRHIHKKSQTAAINKVKEMAWQKGVVVQGYKCFMLHVNITLYFYTVLCLL